MIHSKIDNTTDGKAWYIRKSTKKVMQTHHTLENFICDLATLGMRPSKTHQDLQGADQKFVLILECTMLFHYFVDATHKKSRKRKIQSKINKTNKNISYSRKSTKKSCKRMIRSKISSATLQPYDTFVMWPKKTHRCLQGRRSTKIVYHAFASLCLLIFECIMLFNQFLCEVSSVSCFFITFLGSH